jgi:hypothetical protein
MARASTSMVDAWIASSPVTRLDQLAEFANVGDVPKFNPFFEIAALKNTRGLTQFDWPRRAGHGL